MEKYSSIFVLKDKLEKAGIPFNVRELYDGYQICYPNKDNCVCSVVEHFGSYGSEKDLLEIMGLVSEYMTDCDDVEGSLTADEVFEKIEKHFRSLEPYTPENHLILQIEDCKEIAENESEKAQDDGTCNFDKCMIQKPEDVKKEDFERIFFRANLNPVAVKKDGYKNWYFVGIIHGQANKNTVYAKTLCSKLMELGYYTSVWFQMD